jgi:hypothetical protein
LAPSYRERFNPEPVAQGQGYDFDIPDPSVRSTLSKKGTSYITIDKFETAVEIA